MDTAGAAKSWSQVRAAADAPVPPMRSAFHWTVDGESVVLFGGYCKIAKSKKAKGPPQKTGGTAAVAPSEEDEFEQLGRGVTYTDAWRLSRSEEEGSGGFAWARLQTTGEVITPSHALETPA